MYGPCVELLVDGLQGGHSGVEIHKNRANANKVMGELLVRIQEKMPVCIVSLSGGAKDNAIPRSCRVNLVAMGLDLDLIRTLAESPRLRPEAGMTIRRSPSPSGRRRLWGAWP